MRIQAINLFGRILVKITVCVIALVAMHQNSRSQTISISQHPFNEETLTCTDLNCFQKIMNEMTEEREKLREDIDDMRELYNRRGAVLKDLFSIIREKPLSLNGCDEKTRNTFPDAAAEEKRSEHSYYERCLTALRQAQARAQVAENAESILASVSNEARNAGTALIKLADAGWQASEKRCREVRLTATFSKTPGDSFACQRCGDLQWIEFAPSPRPADDRSACASGRVGFARYPITGKDMNQCAGSGRCEVRDAFAVDNETPVTSTIWKNIEEYVTWVNEQLLPLGFRARLPRIAELIAIAGTVQPQAGGRERKVQDLHRLEAGIAILPSSMKEWTQDCMPGTDGNCIARKTFAVSREHRLTSMQSEHSSHSATAFRIVVEPIVPAPFLAGTGTGRAQ